MRSSSRSNRPGRLPYRKGSIPATSSAPDLRLYDLLTQPCLCQRAMRVKKGDAARKIELTRTWKRTKQQRLVIAPSRTTTGRAILANDRTWRSAFPVSRMITHLAAPGFNLVGADQPGLPACSRSHTDRNCLRSNRFSDRSAGSLRSRMSETERPGGDRMVPSPSSAPSKPSMSATRSRRRSNSPTSLGRDSETREKGGRS